MKLGFSIYPEKASEEKILEYINQMALKDVKRVFCSFLQISPKDEALLSSYQRILQTCQDKGLEVFADINESLLLSLGWIDDPVAKARAFGLSGIRLDEFEDKELLIQMVENNQEFKIELNASTGTYLLDFLIDQKVSLDNVTACHNFYPRKWTGLSIKRYQELSKVYKEKGIPLSAFICSDQAKDGAWEFDDHLVTLETHRDSSLIGQVKWFLADGLMDVLVLSTQFVESEEMTSLIQEFHANQEMIQLRVKVDRKLTEVEKNILGYPHTYRPDVSDYLLRSTMPRVVYKDEDNPPCEEVIRTQPGTVVIVNNLGGRYKNELNICLKYMNLDITNNYIGQIIDEDLDLLRGLEPGQSFRLIWEVASE